MIHTFTIGHWNCGIGGSALGAKASSSRVGDHSARFQTLGGIDVDPLACQDFERLTGAPAIDNGAAAVADPRLDPDKPPPFTPIIIAADGTWHRPLTTLELAALQGFPVQVDGQPLVLAGKSHTRWREAIGNAVPPPAAQTIGDELLKCLLVSALGLFALATTDVWVQPEEGQAA